MTADKTAAHPPASAFASFRNHAASSRSEPASFRAASTIAVRVA
jgi:hypothetical protein